MSDPTNSAIVASENPTFVKATTALSHQLGLEPRPMIDAIKTQFFKGKEATDAQLAVVISTARELGLNPLIPGQLYPYPDRSGAVTIMLGPDGIYTLLANNKNIVAQKDGGPAYWTEHGKDAEGKDTCTGFINHSTKGLLKKTIWVDEWIVQSNPNWASRRRHMSEIRALKQAARMVIHGIPADTDEIAIGETLNVTPEPVVTQTERPAPPKRQPRGSAGAKAAVEAEIIADQSGDTESKPATKPVEKEPAAPAAQPTQNNADSEKRTAPSPEAGQSNQAPQSFAEAAQKTAEDSEAAPLIPVAFRESLSDGETATFIVKVTESSGINIANGATPTPSVLAKVFGEYSGEVRMLAAGVKNPDGTISPAANWQVGKHLRVTLLGRKSVAKPPHPNAGKVIAWCQKCEEINDPAEAM